MNFPRLIQSEGDQEYIFTLKCIQMKNTRERPGFGHVAEVQERLTMKDIVFPVNYSLNIINDKIV